ncbi:Glycosyl transferase, family 2 [Rhodopirellula maiorica SM1]|uniref:Glycosyl transferase, family 2 n=1 Tax=Rhodopirellula maiorica SM1 TaxID=1265738 RepID=M5RR96_9BACT|nr:glycosyltransferase [Rhodopirellula maiorica]EMI17907.1 Glycosyl transferase, family 2 [Rhodopirellula maiorica SM1]
MTGQPFTASDVTIVIPTIGRETVLLDTILACLQEPDPPCDIIVVDQSKQHEEATTRQLDEWQQQGMVKVLTPEIASQPAAMNVGLLAASSRLLLFLDDDVEPSPGFVAAHAAAHNDDEVWCVVGQIIQPWQKPEDAGRIGPDHGLRRDLDFPFHSTHQCHIYNGMSGHMSVTRKRCFQVGGFDENFKGAAYRFDTEFSRRVIKHGGKVLFYPKASLKHLRVARGGTRLIGNHLASANPIHGVGDYYFALQQGEGIDRIAYISKRMVREFCTKFHLIRPWFIPVKLLGEIRAFLWACRLCRQGPALVKSAERE